MARFSRVLRIKKLREMSETIRRVNNFDPKNGTDQLHLRGVHSDDLIRRTVRYAEWRTIIQIADDLDAWNSPELDKQKVKS